MATVEDDTTPNKDVQHLEQAAENVAALTTLQKYTVLNHKTPMQPQVQELDKDESSDDDMVIDAIEGENGKNWNTTVGINKHPVQFKINTGAQCNVMSSQTYHQLSQRPLQKSKARLIAFGGNRLSAIGKTSLLCEYKGKYWPVEFEVVNNVSNILGLHACTEMQMVK